MFVIIFFIFEIYVIFLIQGHIWRTGFENKELQGVVYDDVPEALKKWHESGIKVKFVNPDVVYFYTYLISIIC